MNTNSLKRIIYLPIGLLRRLMTLAKDGSRDYYNSKRFKNSIVDESCSINERTQIGENCHILDNCLVLNTTIANYTYVGKRSMIQNTTIGSYCSIANDVCIGLGKHPLDFFSTSPIFYRTSNPLRKCIIKENKDFVEYESIVLGNDVWIGARAIVMDGVKIGHGAVVAANSVVTKDVPPYAIVGGVPAKIIKYRFTPEKVEKMLQIEWWNWPAQEIVARSKELELL